MYKKLKIGTGFTLVELLLYMGILIIFMSVLAGLFSMTVDLQLEASANTGLDRDAQFIFARLAYDIHRADSIDLPLATGSPSSTLGFSVNGTNYTYSLDSNGNLLYVDGTGNFVLNSYDTQLENLVVTKIGNIGGIEDTVKISFTLKSTTYQRKGLEAKDFETTIGMRR